MIKDRSPDQIIHEAMGLCWHELPQSGIYRDKERPGSPRTVDCIKCGDRILIGLWNAQLQWTDYAKDLRPVEAWLQKDARRIYSLNNFLQPHADEFGTDSWYFWATRDGEQKRDLIAQWIKSNPSQPPA